MKRQLSSLVIAGAVITGSLVTPVALNNVKAATVQQNQTVLSEKAFVNGNLSNLHYSVSSNSKLYSSKELAKLMSASMERKPNSSTYTFTKTSGKTKMTLNLQVKSTIAVLNGKKVRIAKAPVAVGGTIFIEPISFIRLLGGDAVLDSNLLISTNSVITFGSEKINFDGQTQSIKTIRVAGKLYYAAKDFAKFTGAAITVDKAKQVYFSKNNKSTKINLNPFTVKGNVYADINELVKGLGGDLVNGQSGKFVATAGLISGEASNPRWISNAALLINNTNEDGELSHVISVNSKKLVSTINATDLTVAPDGKSAIYSDDDGYLYVVDLATNQVTTLNNKDNNPKFNFVWSNDGTQVYFISGSSMTGIGSVKMGDGSITNIFTDTRAYKQDLALSPNGKMLMYTVGKEGVTNYDPNSDVSGIDLSGTENQINVIDLTAATKTAVQLTSSTDNKVFPAFVNDGTICFTSFDTEDDTKLPVMYKIDLASKDITIVLDNKDISYATVTPQGKLVVAIREQNGNQTINTVDPTTKKVTKLAQTQLEITSMSYSADGTKLAITVAGDNGDRVFVLNNGQFEALTK